MTSLTVSRKRIRSSAARTLRRLKGFGQRFPNGLLLILTVGLIILAGVLLELLANQTFKPYLNCGYLIDGALHTDQLCRGIAVNFSLPFPISKTFSFPILPALNAINPPLETFRRVTSWAIILFFALVSLALTYIVSKIIGIVKGVVRLLSTPGGRKVVMTNLSIWLFFFVICCALFYFNFVAGKQ